MKRISVLLADDHSLLMEGLARLLRRDFDVVGTAQDGKSMVEMAKQHKPDVIVADISMPGLNGIDAARIVRREAGPAKILFLTMHSDLPLVEEAFRAGATGFAHKVGSTEETLRAIRAVAAGETYITPLIAGDLVSSLMTGGPHATSRETALTARQRQILQLLAEGKTMKEAAVVMDISTRTAESHKYEIMRKLGVQTTADLIRHAIRLKLV